jgi:DNA-binding transcriptional MocR family regulator
MPLRPRLADLPPRVEIDPKHPFEKLAVELRDRIYAGDLAVGLPIPSAKDLARQHGMSPSTAQRAVQLLSDGGLASAFHLTCRTNFRETPRLESCRDRAYAGRWTASWGVGMGAPV